MKKINLDSRLQAIVDILGEEEIVADVGCDHGYVANYLVENSKAKLVYATDISLPSLNKNKAFTLERENEETVISVLGDGLKPIEDKKINGIIIAGMGGDLIIKILEGSIDFIQDKVLILQPMTSSSELRKYLYEKNFRIEKERIVQDKDKFYEIIRAKKGISKPNRYGFYFDNELVGNCDEDLLSYVSHLLKKSKTYLSYVRRSNSEEANRKKEKLQADILLYEEILNGCKGK